MVRESFHLDIVIIMRANLNKAKLKVLGRFNYKEMFTPGHLKMGNIMEMENLNIKTGTLTKVHSKMAFTMAKEDSSLTIMILILVIAKKIMIITKEHSKTDNTKVLENLN